MNIIKIINRLPSLKKILRDFRKTRFQNQAIERQITKFSKDHRGRFYLVLQHLNEPIYYQTQAREVFKKLTGHKIDNDDLALGCLHLSGLNLNQHPKPAIWYLFDSPYTAKGFIGLIIGENAKLAYFPEDCCRFERLQEVQVILSSADSRLCYCLKMTEDEKEITLYLMIDNHLYRKITDRNVIRQLILYHHIM